MQIAELAFVCAQFFVVVSETRRAVLGARNSEKKSERARERAGKILFSPQALDGATSLMGPIRSW